MIRLAQRNAVAVPFRDPPPPNSTQYARSPAYRLRRFLTTGATPFLVVFCILLVLFTVSTRWSNSHHSTQGNTSSNDSENKNIHNIEPVHTDSAPSEQQQQHPVDVHLNTMDAHKNMDREQRNQLLQERLQKMSGDLQAERMASQHQRDALERIKMQQMKVDEMLEKVRKQQLDEHLNLRRDDLRRGIDTFLNDDAKRREQLNHHNNPLIKESLLYPDRKADFAEALRRHITLPPRVHDALQDDVARRQAAIDSFQQAQHLDQLQAALREGRPKKKAFEHLGDIPHLRMPTDEKGDPFDKRVGEANRGHLDEAELKEQQRHTLQGEALEARIRHDVVDLTARHRNRLNQQQQHYGGVEEVNRNTEKPVVDALLDTTGAVGASLPPLRVVFFTTLKPCDEHAEEARYAQLDAVMNWALLSLEPHIYLLGKESCQPWVAARVNRRLMERNKQNNKKSDSVWQPFVRVLPEAPAGPSGTILLGPAMKLVAQEEPLADIFAFLNADILLHPQMVPLALRFAASEYREFFLVGHRLRVNVLTRQRASYVEDEDNNQNNIANSPKDGLFSVTDPKWVDTVSFATADKDRVDAEDYFFWTRDFFASVSVPAFHIGRPAYDNWLVHHAIHTWKPVLDASELFIAYHQQHGYQHLSEQQQGGGGGGESAKKSPPSYWGKQEQQENYGLGIRYGGWQHGLIEFSPLQFVPESCHQSVERNLKEQQQSKDIHHEKELLAMVKRHCHIGIGPKWRPFGEDAPFQSLNEANTHYERFRNVKK